MKISFDARGREILSDIPAAFNVPVQKRISTLDFHRQRLLEQREAMRRALEDMQAEAEQESFKEANDFAVEDPFDEFPEGTDFELDDDSPDGLDAVAERMYRESVEETARANRKNIEASTEKQSPPESAS
nr:unnamed protein product [uncultured bacterium]